MQERRHAERKKFNYYMRVMDDETGETVGHLVDVSIDGMRLETPTPPTIGQEFHLHMELTPDISDSLFLFLLARVRWCRSDEIMPNLFHVGLEITKMTDHDKEIYKRLIDKYGI